MFQYIIQIYYTNILYKYIIQIYHINYINNSICDTKHDTFLNLSNMCQFDNFFNTTSIIKKIIEYVPIR